MCYNNDCGVIKRSADFAAVSTAQSRTLQFPKNVYIWSVEIGSLGAACTFDVTLPGQSNVTVLDLAANGVSNRSLAPGRQLSTVVAGAGISGTSVPWFVHDGRIKLDTNAAATTAGTVTVLASESPPPWR